MKVLRIRYKPCNIFLSSFFFQRLVKCRFFALIMKYVEGDLMRLEARPNSNIRESVPSSDFLHFGRGGKIRRGWLNGDITGSESAVGMAFASLAWKDSEFQAAAGRPVIEHLEINTELFPFLVELKRVPKLGRGVVA
jgi:hypothetical protein